MGFLPAEIKTFKAKNVAGKYIFFKINFKKMIYFLMFGSVMKIKLENIF